METGNIRIDICKKKLQKTIKLGCKKHLTSLYLPMCIVHLVVVSYKQFSCTMT